jgi:serine-type D-Ala-D-Ala carboxypeptidase/endopeptidase (penicillin-binding protein 4)
VFVRLLRDRGITVGAGARAGTAGFAAELAAVESAPMSDVVHEMLETSDDNTAEMLVKEIGFSVNGAGTTAAGLAAIADRLEAWGVPTAGLALADGSGLSRDNAMSCSTLLAVLQLGAIDDAVGQGLPVAAQTGTLSTEFQGTPMAGRLRAKTGSLTDVKALAGYVPAEDGAVIEFVLLLNELGINQQAAYSDVWDRLLATALDAYPSATTADALEPR